ncbi:MAG: trigger factor, partial [Nocardioidaceae bacterium]
IPEMVSEVVRGKALASIVESATVTDESGHHVELKNLQPDGTIADPADEVAEPTEESSESTEEKADA